MIGKNKKISNLVDPQKLGVAEISTAPQRKSKFRPPLKKRVFGPESNLPNFCHNKPKMTKIRSWQLFCLKKPKMTKFWFRLNQNQF